MLKLRNFFGLKRRFLKIAKINLQFWEWMTLFTKMRRFYVVFLHFSIEGWTWYLKNATSTFCVPFSLAENGANMVGFQFNLKHIVYVVCYLFALRFDGVPVHYVNTANFRYRFVDSIFKKNLIMICHRILRLW